LDHTSTRVTERYSKVRQEVATESLDNFLRELGEKIFVFM